MKIIVIGGGKFGKKALEFGIKNESQSLLIDINPNCIASELVNEKFTKQEELLSKINEINPKDVFFLIHENPDLESLINAFNPDYIIPVLPIHLMASIISFKFNKLGILLVADKILSKIFVETANSNLILNYNSEKGIVLLSYAKAGEVCPDKCLGPLNYCPNFKREKPITITQHVKEILSNINGMENEIKLINHYNYIIESEQLKSGLGGLNGNEVKTILDDINNNIEVFKNKIYTISIATTCNCHGIINFFTIQG